MTRVLFLPNDQTICFCESPLTLEELLESVRGGFWRPPEPYQLPVGLPLNAFRLGGLIILSTAQSMDVEPAEEGAPIFDRQLSPRQRQVLQALAEGLTTKQIALRLGLHPRTVALHVAALKARFGSHTRAQSVDRAAALGYYRPRREKDSG